MISCSLAWGTVPISNEENPGITRTEQQRQASSNAHVGWDPVMQPDSMGTMKTLPFSFSAKENTSRAEAMSKGLVRRHIRIPTFMERTLRFRGTALVPFPFRVCKISDRNRVHASTRHFCDPHGVRRLSRESTRMTDGLNRKKTA